MSNIKTLTAKEQEILQLLKTVVDPEVAVNIVDLGLVYEINLKEDKQSIQVIMTMSTRGCPLGDVIVENVQLVIEANYSGYKADVEVVWEPEWSPDLITEAGRKAIEEL